MPPPERKRKPYPTDLSDKEWTILEPLVPAVKAGGRPARGERREIANAIFYVVRSGCPWRQLPHDCPPWQTVFYYFRTWRRTPAPHACAAPRPPAPPVSRVSR